MSRKPTYEELEEEIIQLKRTLCELASADDYMKLRLHFHLRPTPTRVLLMLLGARSVLSRDFMMNALYGGMDEEPFPKIIDIWIYYLRKGLGPKSVKSVRGEGFMLAPEARQRVQAVLDAAA
jgi:DNA-binding response OmpR family regulator